MIVVGRQQGLAFEHRWEIQGLKYSRGFQGDARTFDANSKTRDAPSTAPSPAAVLLYGVIK